MRRTQLHRKTGLHSRAVLKRRKPMRKRPAKLKRHERSDPEYREWILRQPSMLDMSALSIPQVIELLRCRREGCVRVSGIIEGHHVRRFGERKDDRRMVPMFDYFHNTTKFSVHGGGGNRRFEARFDVDFENAIEVLNAIYEWEKAR